MLTQRSCPPDVVSRILAVESSVVDPEFRKGAGQQVTDESSIRDSASDLASLLLWPLSSLFNPHLEQFDLLLRQPISLGGHHLFGVLTLDKLQQ